MYVKELVIQGLFGVAKGVRLPLQPGLNEPLLPPPLNLAKFRNVLTLLFFPDDAERAGVHVDITVPYPVRLGAVLDIGGLEYKFVWDLKADSLQVASEGRTLGTTRQQAQKLWANLLDPTPLRFLNVLHFHDFDPGPESDGAADKTAKLVEEFRRALSVEAVELEMHSVESQLRELDTSDDPVVRLEVTLEKINRRLKQYARMPKFADGDRDFLEGYEGRSRAMSAELADTDGTLTQHDQTLGRLSPTPLLRDKVFWLGIAAGVACMVAASVLQKEDPKMRAVALGNVLGFGLSLMTALRGLGQVSKRNDIYGYRTELRARQTEISKSIEKETLRLKRLKQKYEAGSAEEILGAVEMRDKLERKRAKIEDKLKKFANDANFVDRRSTIDQLREKLDKIKARRKSYGEFVMPTFELRGELENRGIAADALLPLDAAPDAPIVEAAKQLGVIPNRDTIESDDLEVFNKMLADTLGKPQIKARLAEDTLQIIDDGPPTPLGELDLRHQIPYLRALALAVLAAHNRARTSDGDHLSILVLDDPWRGMQRNDRVRLYSRFKELANKFQILIPKVGE